MRSFNKLANLHRVFFKKAGPGDTGLDFNKVRQNIGQAVNDGVNKAVDAGSAFASRQGLGQSQQDNFRRNLGAQMGAGAGNNFLGHMMNPRNGGNPILAAANRNVMVPGAMAAGAAAPDVKKMMSNVFKSPKASPDNFNDVNNAPPRKY